jgi:hypothetical protein
MLIVLVLVSDAAHGFQADDCCLGSENPCKRLCNAKTGQLYNELKFID